MSRQTDGATLVCGGTRAQRRTAQDVPQAFEVENAPWPHGSGTQGRPGAAAPHLSSSVTSIGTKLTRLNSSSIWPMAAFKAAKRGPVDELRRSSSMRGSGKRNSSTSACAHVRVCARALTQTMAHACTRAGDCGCAWGQAARP